MTNYLYDNFGRLKITTYPEGIMTARTLQWAGTLPGRPANAKFYSYTETAGSSTVWVWYDVQGREIRRDAYGLNGNLCLNIYFIFYKNLEGGNPIWYVLNDEIYVYCICR